jgi:hypothetical protein
MARRPAARAGAGRIAPRLRGQPEPGWVERRARRREGRYDPAPGASPSSISTLRARAPAPLLRGGREQAPTSGGRSVGLIEARTPGRDRLAQRRTLWARVNGSRPTGRPYSCGGGRRGVGPGSLPGGAGARPAPGRSRRSARSPAVIQIGDRRAASWYRPGRAVVRDRVVPQPGAPPPPRRGVDRLVPGDAGGAPRAAGVG